MKKVNSIEEYMAKNSHFEKELTVLRDLISSTELVEHLKWNAPVYSYEGKNVLGLGAFKKHFGIWFFNGVFLNDDNNLLEQVQEKTKALRQMRFESMDDIDHSIVLKYIKEAISNQSLGKILRPERGHKAVSLPPELKTAFALDSALKNAFEHLTPGKQNEYSEYIKVAKRDATKRSRLETIKPMIIKGIGLNDKYKNC